MISLKLTGFCGTTTTSALHYSSGCSTNFLFAVSGLTVELRLDSLTPVNEFRVCKSVNIKTIRKRKGKKESMVVALLT